jgi:hypothetical protein
MASMISLVGPLSLTVALSTVAPPPLTLTWPRPIAKRLDNQTVDLIVQCNELEAKVNELLTQARKMEAETARIQAEMERMIKVLEQRQQQKPIPKK